MISKSPEHAAETLTQVWRDSNLAMVYLSEIPLEEDGLSQTAKFLNQVSDYSYSLSRKNLNGEELTDEDFENLETIYNFSISLQGTLNQLSEELYNGTISWSIIENSNDIKFAQSVDSITVFSNIDEDLNNYEGLIYDGAYSDHVEKVEKLGLTGDDISEDEAEKIVNDFFEDKNIENIEYNGFLENADIPSYDFFVKIKDEENDYSIMISKKGGHVVETSTDRTVMEEKISEEEAKEIGKMYLKEKGFPNMKETYFVKQNNIITVNYAYEDNSVICYPDLIKVRIALDDGEILGIETTGYLNSHTDRNIETPKISIDEARENVNSKLEILSEGRAIIPTEWKTEIDCYEFKGKVDDKEFLVYINSQTGDEENILVILDTPGGTLTI
jgi:germination protein YpeB